MNRKVKKIAGVVMAISLLTLNTGCLEAKRIKASGNYITKEIEVSNFNAIRLQGSEDVLYSQSTNGMTSVKVYASDNVVDLIDVRVENETLVVSHKKNFNIFGLGNNDKIKVIVCNPDLNNIRIQGSGDFLLKTAVKSNKMDISIQGSGDLKGNEIYCNELSTSIQGSGDIALDKIKCETAEASVQGSGDIALAGEAKNVSLKTQGSGDINAANLKGQNVTAITQGSGDIKCYATGYLKAQIHGSGDISYRGKPNIDFNQNKKLNKMD